MTDPVEPSQEIHADPAEAPGSPPVVEGAAPAAEDAAPTVAGAGAQVTSDHRGLLGFAGALALVLLFVAAVGAASMPGGHGSNGDASAATQGDGNAYGQHKRVERQQQRAERQAEQRRRQQERKERQAERKERQKEFRKQRWQGRMMTPKVAETLSEQTGTIVTQTATDGTTTYLLETANGTLVLDIGPLRYWGENPLAPFVGQTVKVTGVQKIGSDRFAVFTVDDTVLRGPGRPPWAGGWKADGQQAPTTSPGPGPSPTPSPAP